MSYKLSKSLSGYDKSITKNPIIMSGMLGVPIGGLKLVQVPGRNTFVYVRLRNNQNELIQAFNNKVAQVYDLPVLLARDGNKYSILGVDTKRYENNWADQSSYLPMHGNSHSFTPDNSGGGDMVWVYSRQFMPMLVFPSGSFGGPDVVIAEYVLKDLNGNWKYIGNTGTANLTQYKPTGSTALMVLVYVDSTTGNPAFLVGSGSHFLANITGTSDIVPYIPSSNNPAYLTAAAIRLVSGTSVIGWDNIYDVRQFIPAVPTGTAGGGLSSIPTGTMVFKGYMDVSTNPNYPAGNRGDVWRLNGPGHIGGAVGTYIETAGYMLCTRDGTPSGDEFTVGIYWYKWPELILNQVKINTSYAANHVAVFVDSSSNYVKDGGILGTVAQKDGTGVGTGTIFNFVGNGVDVSVSGSVIRVFITGSAGGGIPSGTIQVFNSGTFMGSADKLDFQYPLAVGFTGTKAYPYLNGYLLAGEDVSAQITGSNAHFTLTGTIALGTDRLYYNGLHQQRTTHYIVDTNGKGFQTLFTGTFGDVLIMEYGNAGAQPVITTPISIYDDSVFRGQADKISLDTGLTAVVSGTTAFVSNSNISGDFVKLIDIVLASPTGSFVLANIPQTYTHLQIKASFRDVTGSYTTGEIVIEFNGDTTFTNYFRFNDIIYPSGTANAGLYGDTVQNSTSNLLGSIPGALALSGSFSSENMDILDYRNTNKFKSIHRQASMYIDATGYGRSRNVDATVGWKNSSAITSIRISLQNYQFNAQSRVTLYGLN